MPAGFKKKILPAEVIVPPSTVGTPPITLFKTAKLPGEVSVELTKLIESVDDNIPPFDVLSEKFCQLITPFCADVVIVNAPIPPETVAVTLPVLPDCMLDAVVTGSVAKASCGAPNTRDIEARAVDISLFCHDRLGVFDVFIFWLRVLILLILNCMFSPLLFQLKSFIQTSASIKLQILIF